ncbi:MAG: L-seryl-tRNA(Ser) seleniumtransferase [Abditibacteriota bacterium]|nr:L-seryl-tRNA(Ser) seleniumtransferase [Abditibacteriota bacterium]
MTDFRHPLPYKAALSVSTSTALRALPRVDEIAAALSHDFNANNTPSQSTLVICARDAIAATRQQLLREASPDTEAQDAESQDDSSSPNESSLAEQLRAKVLSVARKSLKVQRDAASWPRRVINGTGIVIHTGLGRARLSRAATEAARMAAMEACALEVDLESGERGHRDAALATLLREITGCEDATVCNNCAAATLLSLSTLAAGKEAICARGELVEIGGGFRMPDVMRQSGAILREVGSTNKTRLADYEEALGEATGVLLKVHPSNFRIVGFSEAVELPELVQLGSAHGVAVMEDLGSGVLLDLSRWGLPGEPTVQERVRSGADVICFSGDKLLGGPQCGIIVGKRESIARIRSNPLMRAVRCDKMTLAALHATLIAYRDNSDDFALARQEIPTLRAITEAPENVKARAGRLARRLRGIPATIKVLSSQAQAGAGALPTQTLPSWAVVLQPHSLTIDEFARRLRASTPSVWGRVHNGALWLDIRTISDEEVAACAEALAQILPQDPLSERREIGSNFSAP